MTASWCSLATPAAPKRALWFRGVDSTRWAPCGITWDTVAITPMTAGLRALDTCELSTQAGHPVLGDHLSNLLYVLVVPGSADASGLPGVRVLGAGRHVLMPSAGGTAAADWLSPPYENPPALVDGEQFVGTLREQLDAEAGS